MRGGNGREEERDEKRRAEGIEMEERDEKRKGIGKRKKNGKETKEKNRKRNEKKRTWYNFIVLHNFYYLHCSFIVSFFKRGS